MESLIYVKHPNPLKEPDSMEFAIQNRQDLIINEEYSTDALHNGYYSVFKNRQYLGLYPQHCFKSLKQLRKKKLKALK